ncbi:cysteine hydrolase family protein [Pseudonocardia lacus]|uniref:cysteine hydrolase family protein n=1 Tax=Pseudonocardia lacus TaxID=2835865 RepID=UPI0027E261B9|nr:isochorismatase family protein [Pseudonocardia lacus]
MTAAPAGHLVVVDMQRVFADPGSGWATPGFAAIVDTVAALVEAFDPAVTLTRFVSPARPRGAWREYYRQWPFALQPPDAPLWDVVPELARPHPTVDAPTFSKWGPELAARVGDADLVLAGVSTDCCVLSTALAAADAGVAVRVVADACAGGDEAGHRKALDVMRLYAPLVEVVTADEVLV